MNSMQVEELYNAIDNRAMAESFIVMFSANKITELAIKYINKNNMQVAGVIDNDVKKSGTYICGVRIYTPEELLGNYREDALIFVNSRYFKQMSMQLQKMGYSAEKHIAETIYHSPNLSMKEMENYIDKVKQGERVYKELVDNRDVKLLLCPYKGLGDAYFVGAYAREYCRQNSVENYEIVVIGNVCKRVIKMFGIENVVVVSQKDANNLVSYVSFVGESKVGVKILNHNCVHFNIFANFEILNKASWGTIFKEGILEINLESKAENPEKLETVDDIYEKTVILSPYANTVENLEIEFWDKIVLELKNKGYEVLTNSQGDEEVIKGTRGINYKLEQMLDAVNKAGIFIGVRSGLCDIISSSNAKKVVLYPQEKDLFFSITDMGISDNTDELLLEGLSVDERVRLVLKEIL